MHKKKPFSFHGKPGWVNVYPKSCLPILKPFPYAATPPVGATVSMWSLPELEGS